MRKIIKSRENIFLCDLTHDYQILAMDKMPLAIGMIASYCKRRLPDDIKVFLFKFINNLIEKLNKVEPFIIGFSNYVWNQNLNIEISKRIKLLYPKAVIVFGGPNFPIDYEKQINFMRDAPWIDFYMLYEGEESFTRLVEAFLESGRKIEKLKRICLPNTVSLIKDKLFFGEILDRIDIQNSPSPYLDNFFDKYFGKLEPMIQTTRGCPFSCTYCYDGLKYWNKIIHRDLDVLEEELKYIVERCDNSDKLSITDANFGMFKEDVEFCNIISKFQKKYNWPWEITLNTGKRNKHRILQSAEITSGAISVTASIQSSDPIVLRNIKRKNLPLKDILWIAEKTKNLHPDSSSNSDVILCLPGDTIQAHTKSIKDLIDNGIEVLATFQLMMLPGVSLVKDTEREKYKMVTKYRVLPRCFGIYKFLDSDNDIITAEIEEICVENNTLGFEDYIECRKFHLTIAIFYNDFVLSGLYNILRFLGFSVFDFIKDIQIYVYSLKMKEIYDGFIDETKEELWDSPKEILNFIRKPGIINKYKEGSYGSNLLYKWKVISYLKHMDFIIESAYKKAFDLINKNYASLSKNLSNIDIIKVMQDLRKLHKSLAVDFLDYDKILKVDFNYNVIDLHNNKITLNNIASVREKYLFSYTSNMKNYLKHNIKHEKMDINKIAKIISQTHFKKLLRKPSIIR